MSSKEGHDLSVLICTVLDNIGYSEDMISFRASYSDKISENYKKSVFSWLPLKFLSVGSSGEGFRHRDSDIDLLMVFENTVCVDSASVNGASVNTECNVLETDYSNTAPGYTKVVLKKESSSSVFHPFHFGGLFKYQTPEGHPYIPSDLLANLWKDENENRSTITGPAITMLTGTLPGLPLENIDIVFSFYYLGKSHLNKWAGRIRHISWPSNETVHEVSMMPGFIVPIGDKQSDLQNLEWRICFTTAEKELVSKLSQVHKKLYIILKIFAKRTLKPVCKAITSYVIKNVVFWIAEGMPTQELSVKLLINQFQKSLLFIKLCLQNNHLPNFMIPERDLLKGSVFGREKQTVISTLTECLKEESAIITKIPNLHRCIIYMRTQPDTILKYGKWRDEMERQITPICVFLHGHYLFQKDPLQNIPVVRWFQLMRTLTIKDVKQAFNLVNRLVPEFPVMIIRGQFAELYELVNARIKSTMIL